MTAMTLWKVCCAAALGSAALACDTECSKSASGSESSAGAGAGGRGGAGNRNRVEETTGAAGSAGESGSSQPDALDAEHQLVLPLLLSYQNWDYHLFQGLEEHPTYEAAELMVDEHDEEEPVLWFFLTERELPKHQVHYTNDAELAVGLSAGGRREDINEIPIGFELTEQDDESLLFEVTLTPDNGAPVAWTFETVDALSDEYAPGLIDQSEHDLPGGILVMLSPETALASSATSVTLGEQEFPVQVWDEVSDPPYFTAYHGACTRTLGLGYLAAADVRHDALALPAALAAGEQWSYRITWGSLEPYEQDFVIDEVSGQDMTVSSGPATLELEIVDQGLATREMRVENDGGYVAVRFSPSLPDLEQVQDGDQQALDFAIDIDGRLDQITGGLTVEKQADLVELWLSPQTPEWAVINQMHVELELSDTGYDLRVETVQSEASEP